ncbi:MAG TPA: EAL domain-containing protein [Burkholderiales bacterium]|nr:EAL domain-containing protein [Burkholderiales bacterium]
MNAMQQAPLKTKLTIVNLLVTGIALLVMAGIMVGAEFIFMRAAMVDDLRLQARMVSANSITALRKGDTNDAREIISVLSASPHITHAILIDDLQDTIAVYRRSADEDALRATWTDPQSDFRFHGTKLDLAVPVLDGEQHFGTLYIRADLSDFYERLGWYAAMALFIVAAALFVAYLLLLGLRRALTRTEERLEFLAHFDPTTNLPNRNMFNQSLEAALDRARRSGRGVALLFLDLDRFKYINDTLGHHVGDALLAAVAMRLSETVRKSDLVCRLGGDEFTVLVENVSQAESLSYMCEHLIGAVSRPFTISQQEIYIGTSVGISIYPTDAPDAETLIKHADVAMYDAKEKGRNNFQFFSSEMNVRSLRRLALENKLRHAIARNEFTLHYQPQIDLSTGQIVCMEALLRWNEAERGTISPGEFIPVAEDCGLIVAIGEWVLQQACGQMRHWRAMGFNDMRMSVNLSSRQFNQDDLLDVVTSVLRHNNLDPQALELEITEGSLMDGSEHVVAKMQRLRDLGVQLAIDDFGIGYSSMSYLKRFPLSRLKIDSSFVRDIPHDQDDVAITGAIIALAKSLGLGVVAEGVETQAQIEFLLANGCEEAQGYYYARPMPAIDVERILKAGSFAPAGKRPRPAGDPSSSRASA